MAKLICRDGTEIQISDETENSLRLAFGPTPSFKDSALEVRIERPGPWPILIEGTGMSLTRNVKDTEAFIVALQEAVTYCKQHSLGV